jgi:pyruvate dehydrogenase E2 component (dihydrolipoamide acetyltransferase)
VTDSLPIQPTAGERLSRIRRRIGSHMVSSKATSPHVLTAMEVDYESVETVRRSHRSQWKESEGFSLTYLPFIIHAVARSLTDFPRVNASVNDANLVIHDEINVGVAVDLDFEGLVVPVIREVDELPLSELARQIVHVAKRAHARKLVPDEMAGGTFTITNAGPFGTLLQFPIINQPQVAILSTDGVSRKPAVVTDADGNESIKIRSIGILALAWDHRAFDGAYAASFLGRIRELIECTDWESEI